MLHSRALDGRSIGPTCDAEHLQMIRITTIATHATEGYKAPYSSLHRPILSCNVTAVSTAASWPHQAPPYPQDIAEGFNIPCCVIEQTMRLASCNSRARLVGPRVCDRQHEAQRSADNHTRASHALRGSWGTVRSCHLAPLIVSVDQGD